MKPVQSSYGRDRQTLSLGHSCMFLINRLTKLEHQAWLDNKMPPCTWSVADASADDALEIHATDPITNYKHEQKPAHANLNA